MQDAQWHDLAAENTDYQNHLAIEEILAQLQNNLLLLGKLLH